MFRISRISDAELNTELESNLQELLRIAFEDDFSEQDWDHTFGGQRFLGVLNDQLIAHGSVVTRLMEVDGLRMPVGYVEGVAVNAVHWGNGFGSLLMAEITAYCKSEFELSMLSTDEKDFYRKHGWIDFKGRSYVLRNGIQTPTIEEDEGLMCLFASNQDRHGPRSVVCETRSGDCW